jgi:hypothetical protein
MKSFCRKENAMFKLFSMACLIVSTLMVGCADTTPKKNPYWDRAGTEQFTYAELTADQDTCRAKVTERTTAAGKSPSIEVARRNKIIQCMEDKGWVYQKDAGSADSGS